MKIELTNIMYDFQRIDYLIRTCSTGSPEYLAAQLNISKPTVYRLIEDLKSQGLPIRYDKKRRTYYYTHPVCWSFEVEVNGVNQFSIKGGVKK